MSLELDATADDPDREKRRDALTAGAQLGKYRLVRVLGEGGMGVVWAARDPDLERAVAIKVLRHAQATPELRQRLLREAVAMAKLKHPNVLTVYEVGSAAERDYIVMELVEGTTLDAWLAARPPRDEIWDAILAAGRGLAAAHEAGIVHRDFKPHNVLRRRDGRVLVTDFGLARGTLEESESATAATPATMLDAQLTHTGALVGTPAYMAPEQYQGAAPDPRTDQFAYCVTAWQAFTGERPFTGTTIDELRKAVSGGVAHLTIAPERAVRSVLARGLDPKPEGRWPTLEALLDALERAKRLPARRRIVYASVAVIIIATFVIGMAMRRPAAVAHACDAPERAYAIAWSPELRTAVQRNAASVASAFDEFGERWVTSYERACRQRSSRVFPARVACLDSVRDQVGVLAVMMRNAPPAMLEHFDGPGMLPPLVACDRATPLAAPALPSEEPRRSAVLSQYAGLVALLSAPPDQVDAVSNRLEAAATAAGWPPLVALVVVMTADAHARRGNVAHARSLYTRASGLAREAKDHRLQARVSVGLLELAMIELATPGAPIASRLDDPRAPLTLHPEISAALVAARSAANDDPLLLGSTEMLAARAYLSAAQWNRYRTGYLDALRHVAEARKLFESIPDVRRAAFASVLEAEIYLERGDDRALDDAMFAARRASDALEGAGLRVLPALDDIRRRIAFARGEYNEVHRLVDKRGVLPSSPAATEIRGRVSPPARATVVAWRGDLVGDPRRAYTEPDANAIDIVQAADDGSFVIRAEPGWAIMAEAGDTRSVPQAIGAAPLTLALRRTVTQSGTVRGKNLRGVHAVARYRVGDSSWTLEVPVQRDGPFDLRGMPDGGSPQQGLVGAAGDGMRTVTSLVWPVGQALDVIVRDSKADSITVSRDDGDVARAALHPVGASNTDAGRDEYKAGDRHAVITGVAPGKVSVCAAERCKTIDVRPTVEIEYPDGRHAAGVTPVVLAP